MVLLFVVLLFGCDKSVQEGSIEQPPLFSLTDPDSTGLYFINEVTESPQLNILTYEYLYNGSGVALGDVNKDGLLDVFMGGNLFGGRLFLNKGDLKFEQISETAGVFVGGWSTGVSMVDINEDGYDDIYICRSLTSDIDLRRNVLLINNQDNTFTDWAAEYGLDDPSFSHYASFFDYDRDGDLDMYLLNHRIDFKEALKLKYTTNEAGKEVKYTETDVQYVTDKLYRNNGNGSFTDVTEKAGLINRAFGLSVTTADINRDGWADIYVANDYADKDHIYLNNGDGTFTDKVDEMLFHMSKNSMGSDIADFNNDGLPDIISLDMMAEDNERQKLLKGQEPYDLYHAAVDYGLGHQVMRNTLQLNNGNGTFSEIGQLAGISHTDWSWSPLIADFDNDGYKDLFITNGLYRDLTDMDYRNYTSPQAINRFAGDVAGHSLELTQLMPSNPVPNYIYQNQGNLTFTNKSKTWGLDQAAFSNGAVYADLDLDGDLDLITNNFNSEAFLYRNNAREQATANAFLTVKLRGSSANPDGIGAKITLTTDEGIQYQAVSPYRGFASSGDAVAHFGLGSQVSEVSLQIEWPDGRHEQMNNVAINQTIEVFIDDAVEKESKDRGNTTTLLKQVSNALTSDFEHKEDDFIDFKREPLLEHMISNKGPFATKGDVDGDGLEDIYLGGSAGLAGQLYLQQANGGFALGSQPDFETDAGFEDAQAVFFDIEGDGDQDLFVSSGSYAFAAGSGKYQNRLYLNDGQGNFNRSGTALPDFRENSTAVVADDFDKDGDPDLFIAGGTLPGSYPFSARSQLLLNDGAKFSDATALLPDNAQLGMINDVLLADIDGDGTNELIIAGEWMPLKVMKWDGSGFGMMDIPGFENSSGWWNVLTAADMDNDGDLDIIAGNRGENSFYKTSAEKPATLYAKDFDSNSQVDAFPFYYFSDGKSHPKHILDEVAKQYPAIRRKFTRYAPYAKAAVNDIFSSGDLNGALQLKAETFGSTWFENQENGSFKAHTLATQAQFSEVHGILPIDLNKDGYLDLILTGNNYGADVEAGQNDASIGTVLLGNGRGEFSFLPVTESGFSIPGDTRGIIQIGDLLLVMVNGGKPYGFEVRK
ncbi:MAG: VCBS repeat-containing protein [Roseivirga sp.]|nr:VCBS repeat-containing protein [Roseivirga sp.]